MNSQQAWQAAIGQLQMEMSKAAFDTWVRDAELVTHEQDLFTIGVQNAYARDWLESRLSTTITRLLTGIMGRSESVRFVVWHKDYENLPPDIDAEAEEEADRTQEATLRSTTINPRYNFARAHHVPGVWQGCRRRYRRS